MFFILKKNGYIIIYDSNNKYKLYLEHGQLLSS